MNKAVRVFSVAVMVAVLASCSFSIGGNPADEAGKKWIALIEKHKAEFEVGKFDAVAFKSEGTPIAEELKKHRDEKEKKVLLTDEVLKDFKRVTDEFEKLLQDKGTPEQQQAYLDLVNIWTANDEGKANAPAND